MIGEWSCLGEAVGIKEQELRSASDLGFSLLRSSPGFSATAHRRSVDSFPSSCLYADVHLPFSSTFFLKSNPLDHLRRPHSLFILGSLDL